ncbi:c-type cytochrome [Ideonella sp. BN130291]|uniref:c-type cytochrome n=1 Tax=Ideonella sp. BN130291 TaxID=3112940 RepID=UPI002E256BA6|nr:cytochrome c4 [Ideonella sp. BN130291]
MLSFLASLRALAAGAALAACGVLSAAPLQVPDTMAQRMQACAACHGKEGRSTNQGWFPRIAGKPAGYLFNQLANFRDGRRSNATMTYLVDQMSDAYLHDIADYFAGLQLPYPPPQPADVDTTALARGQALVQRGDPQRGIPACVACHGTAMTGVLPATPGLLGLPRDYLVGQFGNWRNGLRRAAAPDCMAQITQRLGPQDIGDLANWLAAQPLPADSRPVPALPGPLPLRCGSVPP